MKPQEGQKARKVIFDNENTVTKKKHPFCSGQRVGAGERRMTQMLEEHIIVSNRNAADAREAPARSPRNGA